MTNNHTKWYDRKMTRKDFLQKASIAMVGTMLIPSFFKSIFKTQRVEAETANELIPFYGKYQAGITSPMQSHVYFAVLDLATNQKEAVAQLFKEWTPLMARMCEGELSIPYIDNHYLPPTDTGEAVGLSPRRLTITVGVAPSFLQKLDLADKQIAELVDLPPFPRDQLQEHYTGGDIVIQACADDPQVAFHAVRNLIRKGRDLLTMRWSQTGFAALNSAGETPRNLFGFKDGTANVTDQAEFDRLIWCDQDNWLKNGTYLIVRRIQMHLETWDRTSLKEQERTFGRYRDSGAPIGAQDEFDEVDLEAKNSKGELLIPEDSHVRLAKETEEEIYRRAFSYANDIDPVTGQFDAGLLFISFQKNPSQFIKIQQSLGNEDKMNEYVTHIGSGLFAILPGVEAGGYLGETLFN